MFQKRMMIVGGCASMMLAAVAGADMIDVNFAGTGLGRNVKISYNDWSMNVFAGQLYHQVNTPEGHWLEGGQYITYCIEITENVSNQVKPFMFAPLWNAPNTGEMGMMKAQAIADMFEIAGAQAFATESTNANRDFAAAMQIMIWEIVYDFDGTAASLNPADGHLKVQNTSGGTLSSGITNAFNALTLALASGVATGSLSDFGAIVGVGVQDQVMQIPAPAALAMFGLAVGVTRGRSRNNA
ncbi:MAG TPA: hypothetical protein PK400_02415 [Phycisphaerales bacterium]|nr:hypothetical protein [Phycisphaerales bacterium]HRQ75745.1 hypothetical protein [Phycisphaerales bacterium]